MRVTSAVGSKPGNSGRVSVIIETILAAVGSQNSSTLVGPSLQTSPGSGTTNIPTPSEFDTPAGEQIGLHTNNA